MTFVYLDTETTGLDPDRHEIWELAYAVDNGPILGGVVYHSMRNADPMALRMNGYHQRSYPQKFETLQDHEIEARRALEGATLVGANPAFDAAFLRARWGFTPWHYRLFDIESYACGALGWDSPRGLKDIRTELTMLGHDIPTPDHSAASDVATLRSCHLALAAMYGRPLP